jgi:hypothetical protein
LRYAVTGTEPTSGDVHFTGTVETAGGFTLTRRKGEKTIFDHLVLGGALNDLDPCSDTTACPNAEVRNISLTSVSTPGGYSYTFGRYFAWDLTGYVDMGDAAVHWDVVKFAASKPSHIHFSIESQIAFYNISDTPANREPVPEPPETITAVFDASGLAYEGVLDMLLRQHGNSVYSEFKLEESEVSSFEMPLVCGDPTVDFSNCETSWLPKFRSGMRVVNTPAGYNLATEFACQQERGFGAFGANTGFDFENFQPQVSRTCLVARGKLVSGGNPLSPHADFSASESGLSGGAIAGITIAVVIVVAAIVVGVLFFLGVIGKRSDPSA